MACTVPCNLPDPHSVAVQFPLLYQQLRLLARANLAVGTGQSLLDTGALVHEVYLRMRQADGTPLPGGRPRSGVVVITKDDGGIVGA